MTEPRVTVLGVYRPTISDEAWQEQWQVTGDDGATREHFESLVLIEGVVEGLGEHFDMSKFGQMQNEFPNDRRRMQVGYDEGLLSADGEILVNREMDCVNGTGPLRFAVYLHCYDPARPLLWQCGELTCPPIMEAPLRLMALMPYNACS